MGFVEDQELSETTRQACGTRGKREFEFWVWTQLGRGVCCGVVDNGMVEKIIGEDGYLVCQ